MLEVEWETLKRVDRYDNVRGLSRTNGVHPLTLLGPIGYVTPAEAEEAFHANLKTPDRVAWSLNKSPCGKAGAVQSLQVHIPYRGSQGPLHLLFDRTGIKVEDEGEWSEADQKTVRV